MIESVSPEGIKLEYLLVDDTWIVPLTEENPMYRDYLNKDKAEQSTPNLAVDEAKTK
jgi:hypothetical protein